MEVSRILCKLQNDIKKWRIIYWGQLANLVSWYYKEQNIFSEIKETQLVRGEQSYGEN
jgi:hypothetical protein